MKIGRNCIVHLSTFSPTWSHRVRVLAHTTAPATSPLFMRTCYPIQVLTASSAPQCPVLSLCPQHTETKRSSHVPVPLPCPLRINHHASRDEARRDGDVIPLTLWSGVIIRRCRRGRAAVGRRGRIRFGRRANIDFQGMPLYFVTPFVLGPCAHASVSR